MTAVVAQVDAYVAEVVDAVEAVAEALDEAAVFEGWDDPRGAELAAARARIWRETGEWVSKAEAMRQT